MIIADDEPIIRRGLRNALNRTDLGIDIVGEAEDGDIAYDLCLSLKPDIVLVDICMPFLNGLELIEKINNELPDAYMIIISGHDEFEYAKKAVKLNVADYILKPVDEEEMEMIIQKVIKQIETDKSNKTLNNIKNKAMDKHYHEISSRYIKEYINGTIGYKQDEFEFYNQAFKNDIGIMVIYPINHVSVYEKNYLFDNELLLFSVENIISELAEMFLSKIVFRINDQFIIAVIDVDNSGTCETFSDDIEEQLTNLLHRECYIKHKMVNHITELPQVCNEIISQIESEFEYTPVVFRAKRYIDKHYNNSEITLLDVAEHVRMNPTYLSRLLKSEIGHSFVDYLTKVRILKSIELLRLKTLKIYEIADLVGYKSQHYFCKAFKKVKGVSPKQFESE
jgi:two-component system response regulator YesN